MQDNMTSTSELPNTKASATPAMTESSEAVNSTVAEPKDVVSISAEPEAPEAIAPAVTVPEISAAERKKVDMRNIPADVLFCETSAP